MAKPPPVERFKITCETDIASLGHVMSALAKLPGLTVTGSELVTDVKTFATQARTNHEVKAEDFLTDWLADHPEFRAREAVQHFRADGRSSGACYTALRELSAKGALRRLGEGRYATLAAKRQPKKAKGKTPVKHDVNHRDFILRLASRNHGRFNTSWMKAQFDKAGRTPGNVSPTIHTLLTRKLIKRVGDSEYVLLAKATKAKTAPKKTKPVAKTNGHAIETEVAANG